MADHTLTVIGISGNDCSAPFVEEHLRACSIVVATKSIQERIKRLLPDLKHIEQWIPIAPVEKCLSTIETEINHHSIVIFTSGDPLFYGLGKLVLKRFPDLRINFLPGISSMQLCFARFGITWDDVTFVSLHGRPLSQLSQFLDQEKLFILTDKKNNPATIGRYLAGLMDGNAYNRYTMYIGERLGYPDEHCLTVSVEEAMSMTFCQPNCLILIKNNVRAPAEQIRFGLTEKDIQHSRGLITKNEVRAAVLHALRLPATGVLWDIGAGSGSISIEAARMNPGLSIYSVDHKPEAISNIECNKKSFSCWNISVLQDMAPGILSSMPRPDRVFIGGSGGMMKEILEYITENSSPECTIVITGVLEKTCATTPELLYELGYDVEISVISTRRFKYPTSKEIEFNPIHIIRGTRTDA